MKKLCLVIIMLAAMLPAAPQVQEDGAVKGVWTMDYDAAVKASKESNLLPWSSVCSTVNRLRGVGVSDHRPFSLLPWTDCSGAEAASI